MGPPVRVLHVDDDPSFGELVETFLERESDRIEVVRETSADDALERLRDAAATDCIVSDYDMPGLNGLAFLERVRESHPDVPFVLFTGKGSEEVASDAISAGVTDYMQKGTGTDQYAVLANRVENAVDRSRARAEAERTHRRLAEVTDSSTDCIWMFDREWEELLFISGYEAVWGRPVEAIREDPEDFLRGVLPEDRDVVEGAMERLSNGDTIDVEYRIRKGNGEPGWVWVKGEPVFEDGQVARVVGFTRDVTERKRRQRALREEREFVDQALDALDDVFYVVDTDRHLRRWNESLATELGYSDAEVAEMEVLEFFPPEYRDRIAEAVAETLATGETTVEAPFLTAEGERVPHEFTGARLTDPEGDVIGLVGVGRDITDRRRRERRLQRTERWFEAVFNDPNLLVGLLDTDGRVIENNETAMAYVDADPEEVRGEPFWETPWWSDEVRPTIREKIERAAAGEYATYEAELTAADGDPYAVSGVVRPVTDDDGTVTSLVVSARDVTDRP